MYKEHGKEYCNYCINTAPVVEELTGYWNDNDKFTCQLTGGTCIGWEKNFPNYGEGLTKNDADIKRCPGFDLPDEIGDLLKKYYLKNHLKKIASVIESKMKYVRRRRKERDN